MASTRSLIASMSSMLRRTCTRGSSRPGSGGRNGEEPGHRASLSQVCVYSSPVSRFRTVTVCASGSIAVTSVMIRTSMSRFSRRLAGVCSSSRDRSLIVPPMWYGRPQLANDTLPDLSNTMISANSSSRRARAATEAPAATPPTTTSLMGCLLAGTAGLPPGPTLARGTGRRRRERPGGAGCRPGTDLDHGSYTIYREYIANVRERRRECDMTMDEEAAAAAVTGRAEAVGPAGGRAADRADPAGVPTRGPATGRTGAGVARGGGAPGRCATRSCRCWPRARRTGTG